MPLFIGSGVGRVYRIVISILAWPASSRRVGRLTPAIAIRVTLGDRLPGRVDVLAVTVDAARGTATWLVNGEEALTVERIGHRSVDRSHMCLSQAAERPHEDSRPA